MTSFKSRKNTRDSVPPGGTIRPVGPPDRGPHRKRRLDPSDQIVDRGKQAGFVERVDLFGRHDLAGRRLLQRDVDANGLAGLDVTADDRVLHSRAPGGFLNRVERHDWIVLPIERREDLPEMIGRKHLDVGRLRQIGHDHFREPRSKPVEIRVARVVLEMHDRDRRLAAREQ